MYSYLNQIYAAIDTNVIKGGNTDSSVAIICKNIIVIENNIQKNVKDQGQLQTLLATASVARYSTSYWLNAAANPKNPWNIPTTISASSIRGAAGCDAAGACTASVTWGICAAAATGPLAGATWTASVLAGGIGCSIGYGVHAAWVWAFGGD